MELHLMSHVELQELTPGSPWKAVAEEVAAQKWKPRRRMDSCCTECPALESQ
ncbi:unnamed protein product [Cladocopium goreaui]|nr:unnamed protein product [Cladocopium goreaui]